MFIARVSSRDYRKQSWMDHKLDEALVEDKIDQEVVHEVMNEHKHEFKWRGQRWLNKILRFTPLQMVLLVLAIIDVAVVLTEILVTLHIYLIEAKTAHDALNNTMYTLNYALKEKCGKCEKHYYLDYTLKYSKTYIMEKECCPLKDEKYKDEAASYVENLKREKRAADSSPKGFVDDKWYYTTGLKHTDLIDTLHLVEFALNLTSIIILGIFVIFVFLEIILEGFHFFKCFMKVLDGVVTIASFILDVIKISKILSKDILEAIIVILLLWLIVRMFNGIMLSEIKRLEFRIKLQRRARKNVELKHKETIEEKKLAETEIKSLQSLARRKKISEEEISMCKPVKIAAKPSASAGLSMIAMMTMGLEVDNNMVANSKKNSKKSHAPDLQISKLTPTTEKSLSLTENKKPDDKTSKATEEETGKNIKESADKSSKTSSIDEGVPFESVSSKQTTDTSISFRNTSHAIYIYEPTWKNESFQDDNDGYYSKNPIMTSDYGYDNPSYQHPQSDDYHSDNSREKIYR